MMKLSNIESRKLLPRFASKIAWMMDALDSIIKPISERVKSIDAPLTLEAIAALTDEELEVLYDQYGVAQYYPELSRSTRDLMLYEMCKIYRYLGTPHAIELLCNYIFDNVPLNVHVFDNLAFDEHGTLIDATLLDVFDIEVNPDLPVLSVDATARLLANIIRFSRNSQALRDIIYTFSEDFSLPIYPLRAGIPAQNWDNNAICEPVTPPTPAYTEITLYYSNNSKGYQTSVTSNYGITVSSSYCYQLYTDEQCTIPWDGYDYSNDYEVGWYNGGVWESLISKVEDMPSTTSEARKNGFILMDTGCMWFCTNVSSSSTYNVGMQSFIRIYPKSQRHYVAYLQYNNKYANATASNSANRSLYPYPSGGTSGNYKAWYSAFPKPTLTRLLQSAGNELPHQDGDAIISDNSWCLEYSHSVSQTFRLVEFTLDRPTLSAWLKADKTDLSVAQYTDYNLYDESGELITYDNTSAYVVLGLFKADKTNCASEINMIQYCVLKGSSGQLAFSQDYATSTISRIWYVKYDDCKVAYFNANKSNYTLSVNARRALYDASGNRIAFDGTKTYTFLQLRNDSDVQNTVRFVNRGSMTFVDSGSGNLVFQNYSNTQYTVASVWYLEEALPEIDLDVNFGDAVTIPAGYTVESVKTSRLYLKADSVSVSGNDVSFVFNGENAYCDLSDTSRFNKNVSPCLSVLALTNDATDTSATAIWITRTSSTSCMISNVTLNSSGVFVSATATYSTAPQNLADALSIRCAMFRYYDSAGNQVMNYFDLQRDLWQYQNGVFSWLGDKSSSAYPAYYYDSEYGKAMRIHLRKI